MPHQQLVKPVIDHIPLSLDRSTQRHDEYFGEVLAAPDGVRIVNGTTAKVNQFPWFVAVRSYTSRGLKSICGGSLISKSWVSLDSSSERHCDIVTRRAHAIRLLKCANCVSVFICKGIDRSSLHSRLRDIQPWPWVAHAEQAVHFVDVGTCHRASSFQSDKFEQRHCADWPSEGDGIHFICPGNPFADSASGHDRPIYHHEGASVRVRPDHRW